MNRLIDLPPEADSSIAKKWNKLLRRSKIFTLVPFVEIVFVAGSMAMGSADKNSDFDLIVGAKTGRIFMARFFCWLVFGILGWRKIASADLSAVASAKADKFCFSHFVAPERYSLSGPHNEYWKKLYLSIVPIYGNRELVQKFYNANAGWVGSVRHCESRLCRGSSVKSGEFATLLRQRLRTGKAKQSLSQRLPHSFQSLAMTEKRQAESVFEKMLSGKFGNVLEKWLKLIQIKKIEKSLKTVKQYKPRIIFNDSELEFHPDTKRIDEFCQRS